MKNDKNKIRDMWNSFSDEYFSREYKDTGTIERIIKNPRLVFPSELREDIDRYFPSFEGVRVCVPSSGDNKAVFAFHLLGAKVTSCDISSEQIKNARRIAEGEGWDIDFKVCDSADMAGVEEGEYELVYTSNGVHTWISDLSSMYKSFNRLLKPGGIYVFFETHPFIRPFDDGVNILRVKKRYDDTSNNDWRVRDFINALLESGFSLDRLGELSAEKEIIGANWWELDEWDEKSDWNKNPYAALPQWMSVCATKRN